MTEKEILEAINAMCEQSLSPDVFEQWLDVKNSLEETRRELIED